MISQILITLFFWVQASSGSNSIISQDQCKIAWDPDRKLNWSDYQFISGNYTFDFENNNDHSSAVSFINADVTFSFNTKNGEKGLFVSIKVLFDCDKSWVKNKSDQLLKHEQLHFDISELYARKLRKLLSKKKLHKSKYSKEVEEIKEIIWKALDKEQSQFDLKTSFSRDTTAQAAWRKKITLELSRLDKYQSQEVALKLKL